MIFAEPAPCKSRKSGNRVHPVAALAGQDNALAAISEAQQPDFLKM
jgi:hypothetical protein